MTALGFVGQAFITSNFNSPAADYVLANKSLSAVTVSLKGDDGDNAGHGSGVILSDGTILTARHVTHDQKNIEVRFVDGRVVKAKVMWEDEEHDVALLLPEIIYVTGSALECKTPDIGTRIEAVGTPLDLGANVHSYGHVASTEIVTDNWKSAIVADLTIAPGSSGGPAFNDKGKVIGITVGAPLATLGMFPSLTGFSIIVPSSAICPLIEQHHRVAAPGV